MSDIIETCRRTAAVVVVFAVLWTVIMVVFGVIGPRSNLSSPMMVLWPMPGFAIAGTGLGVSLLLIFVGLRVGERPQLLLDLSGGYLVFTCFLFGLLEFWYPHLELPSPAVIGIPILAYASIVPRSPSSSRCWCC